jgi:Rrf2 family iron-sulfur cluster assembly transcriptional regulator
VRLTTKGRFAVTAMIDLALREHAGPVSLAGISGRQGISLAYLEQLFSKLRRQHLVESVRGPGGGYLLAREMAAVSVADIVVAVDEPLDATQCGGKENCMDDHRCLTHDLWTKLNRHMVDYLGSVTLHDLVVEQRERLQRQAVSGHIGILRDHRVNGARAGEASGISASLFDGGALVSSSPVAN